METSKVTSLRSAIVETARRLENVTRTYAELGGQCVEYVALSVAQIDNPSERKAARSKAVDELETDIRKSGLAPDVNRWIKVYALVSVCPQAAEMPISAAYKLLPLVRVDARTGKAAIARGYETDLPRLADEVIKGKLPRDTVGDLVQTLRKSKLTPERAAKIAAAVEVRKADSARDKLAELLEGASHDDLIAVFRGLSETAIDAIVNAVDVATGGQLESAVGDKVPVAA